MKNREIIELIAGIIRDPSYSSERLLAKVNKGVGRIAAMVDLPELKSFATVATSTSEAYVALPSTAGNAFHIGKKKALFFVASQTQDMERYIEESWIKFLSKYPRLNEPGEVMDVCVRGASLYYQGIPSIADSLDLHFYRKPAPMVAITTEPDSIPEHLHEDLLVNFGCWDCYKEIEDDETGKTPNTDKYGNLFGGAIAELKVYVGVPDSRPEHYEYDVEDFI